jgi:hypothetical protein
LQGASPLVESLATIGKVVIDYASRSSLFAIVIQWPVLYGPCGQRLGLSSAIQTCRPRPRTDATRREHL